jgi:pyridoxamine 5'-phosphate oxidase
MPEDPAQLFSPGELLPDPLTADPFPLVVSWYNEAIARRDQPNPNAMSLATSDGAGSLSARIVLCKAINVAEQCLVFYTNYLSRKGRDLAADARAAAVFHWDHLDRQVRIEGRCVRTSEAESDAYFATRPWESRIGAWASQQSQPIASREALLAQIMDTMQRFGIQPLDPPSADTRVNIPRPPHWGGYRLYPSRVELWCSGPGRLHDRVEWTRELIPLQDKGFRAGGWGCTRVQP